MAFGHVYVMGDPQAPFPHVMSVLAQHDVLDAAGRVRSDVQLVSIGDHFDYDLTDPTAAGVEGIRVLRWLTSHDPDHVVVLAGNHDLSRVMELATVSDERFKEAAVLARSIDATKRSDGWAAADQREREEFLAAFPEIPTYGLATRDYAAFSTEQRALVAELLLAGRFRLAATGTLADGRTALVTHAGVTNRELALLDLEGSLDPRAIAKALDARLVEAVARVRDDWRLGRITALSLAPLHVPGSAGKEGGGLLYHRPADPERRGADRVWELDPDRPRRFAPNELPRGLTQIAGHTGHAKCLAELGEIWPTPAARARQRGGIRTLREHLGEVVYDLAVLPPATDAADLILVDGEMFRVPAETYQLLELTALDP